MVKLVKSCLNCGEPLFNTDFRAPKTSTKYCRQCRILVKRQSDEKRLYNKRLQNIERLMQEAVNILSEERKR